MKKTEPEIAPVVFTKTDYDALRASMKTFTRQKGRFGSPFMQYMQERGIVRVEKDELFVSSPKEYKRFYDMKAKMDAFDAAEQDRMFELYPEAKEEYRLKLKGWLQECREAIRGVSDKMKI